MASGHTLIADIIEPTIFTPYVLKETEEKAEFVQSGILQKSAQIGQFLAGGGLVETRPTWKDLDNDVENVATEALAFQYGGTPATPSKITTYSEVLVRLTRTKQWSAHKLQDFISGSDAMSAIGSRVGYWESRRLQAATLAVVAGVLADNDAAPTGTEHVQGDLTFDASGVSFVAGTTNFTAENLLDAKQTMGDSQGDLKILAVHSAVYNRMLKNDLIDFRPDSTQGSPLGSFQGMRLIVDDGMPKTGNVYHSYLFAPGALEFSFGEMPKATEIQWLPDAGLGLGQEVLYRRWALCIHPMGHAYVGSQSAKGGPANGDAATANTLAHAASWQRRCPERKQVKFARLITREA
jgi:hypothetical protein